MNLPLFILNNNEVLESDLRNSKITDSSILLDFIRYNQRLPGTKIGCREGDCGACTVLVGRIINNELVYKQIASCLTPLANVFGAHVVTIEGINVEKLTPIQAAVIEEGGTQCGACTPGFIVSLTGFALSGKGDAEEDIIGAFDGNICRCTGYKSIERAAVSILPMINEIKSSPRKYQGFIEKEFIPRYFEDIEERVRQLQRSEKLNEESKILVGGGTDLYVQRPEEIQSKELVYLTKRSDLDFIKSENGTIIIGSGTNPQTIMESSFLQNLIPNLYQHFKLFASSIIRNIATLGGNIANASPIADMVIFFLAFDPVVVLDREGSKREVSLRSFYKGYKTLDLLENEIIYSIKFDMPPSTSYFNFEKVSKRTFLDIASVNSAIFLDFDEEHRITKAGLTAGGVAPIPLFLDSAVEYLIGKELSQTTLLQTLDHVDSQVSPIDDIRGSAEYKRLLLRQLIIAHFDTLFKETLNIQELIQ